MGPIDTDPRSVTYHVARQSNLSDTKEDDGINVRADGRDAGDLGLHICGNCVTVSALVPCGWDDVYVLTGCSYSSDQC